LNISFLSVISQFNEAMKNGWLLYLTKLRVKWRVFSLSNENYPLDMSSIIILLWGWLINRFSKLIKYLSKKVFYTYLKLKNFNLLIIDKLFINDWHCGENDVLL